MPRWWSTEETVDSVVPAQALNSDDSGRDREVGKSGGGYDLTDNGIRQVTAYEPSRPDGRSGGCHHLVDGALAGLPCGVMCAG